MKKVTLLLFLLLCIASSASDVIKVVASIPDIGDMVRIIGAEKVKVTVLATGREDLHAVPVKPSFLPAMNKADLLFSLGFDAEHAWLPALAAEARNPKIREGASGWIEIGKGIEILDKPAILDRSMGEQHPMGNPHYNIGPHQGKIMAENIFNALSGVSPIDTDYFRKNLDAYLSEINMAVEKLKEKGSVLKGIAVVGYHPDLSYLCEFYGMNLIGHIEPKAGVAPTASHLKYLTDEGKKKSVRLVIHNQSQPEKIPLKLALDIGCRKVEIANTAGAKKIINSWISLQEYNLKKLLEATGE
jgi:zinc/manganese transport system substrate-binding protein